MSPEDTVRSAQASGKRWARHPWSKGVARFGYVAKGVVYAVFGGVALGAATDAGGSERMEEGSRSAFFTILEQPFGRTLLGLLGLGLVAYALWRLVQAILDPEERGDSKKTKVLRIANAVSGLIHLALAYAAIELALGGGANQQGDEESRGRIASLMAKPFGPFLVGGVGAIVAGYAIFQFVRAFRGRFLDSLQLGGLATPLRKALRTLGRVGISARALVFLIVGGFVLVAAWQVDPDDARGTGAALRWIEGQPYGPYLLAVVASGLIAYGLFMFAEARWKKLG